jgi:hypothetical protein
MAIVVLVLWMFTAGAGFSLLVSSTLGRFRPAPAAAQVAAASTAAAPAPVTAASTAAAPAPVTAASTAAAPASATASVTTAPTASAVASVTTASTDSGAAPAASAPAASKRELKRAARDRFDPPSLTAAKSAPMVPGLRSLLEFAHPAFAIVGLGFWLCFTLVHQRVLGWIAFGLVTATVGLGLTWFTANARAAKAKRRDQGEPPPSFGIRLVVLHAGAATVTFALAALTALVLSR